MIRSLKKAKGCWMDELLLYPGPHDPLGMFVCAERLVCLQQAAAAGGYRSPDAVMEMCVVGNNYRKCLNRGGGGGDGARCGGAMCA